MLEARTTRTARSLVKEALSGAAGKVARVIVEHLSLVDFRNYATAELTLHPGPNVLVGRNGQGGKRWLQKYLYSCKAG